MSDTLRAALSDAVKRAGLYEVADAMVAAILDGTFADATEDQVRHAVYELVAKSAITPDPDRAALQGDADVPVGGLREALAWLRGSEDSIGRFFRDPIGDVLRLDDVLALLGLAHIWPPMTVGDHGVCADCGAFWPCQYANTAAATSSADSGDE